MPRPKLEVADIFRAYGPAYRREHAGHLNLPQLKVMFAIETCRTEALGGHVAACSKCGHQHIAYNSCRNRHCPKCQGSTAKDWMQARMEDLLPVEYFHAVFTLPSQIADIAYQNKAAVYGLLFKASAQTLLTIAADPKHLGARIGMTSVLHTWGSAMTHHPHVHVIVPGGGLSPDGKRWIGCRPGFFLPVKVLSRLFRRLFLEGLDRLHKAREIKFFGDLSDLVDPDTFQAHLAPLRKADWVVYAKPPFGGPEAVLAYLSRYTHRVAISNHRLISADADTVAFRWKVYRIKRGDRMKIILALVSTTAILVAIPGPNVALIVANTIAYGFRFGAMTVFGTTIGVALQLVVVVLGLAALLEFAASAFLWLKWIGVAYLIYLGVNAWRQGVAHMEEREASSKPLNALFWQGLLLATINPKTLIFNAAFLPQFVAPGSGSSALLMTAAIYLAVVMLGDLVWAASAQSARPVIAKLGRLRHRLTGVLFFGSGIGLALARIDR